MSLIKNLARDAANAAKTLALVDEGFKTKCFALWRQKFGKMRAVLLK